VVRLPRPLEVGDRVRVSVPGQFDGCKGTIRSFRKPAEDDGHDIRVHLDGGGLYGFEFEEVERVETLEEQLRRQHLEFLDSLLDPSDKSLPVAIVQGAIVLGLGVAIVLEGFVRRGFRWPADVEG